MRILFLSGWFPFPTDNGSKLRIYNLLKGLSSAHDISLLAFTQNEDYHNHLQVLLEFCQKIEVLPWKEYNPKSKQAILGYLDLRPRSIVDTYSSRMAQRIQEELSQGRPYDLVIASEITMASYYNQFEGIPAIFEDIELANVYDRFNNSRSVIKKLLCSLNWLKVRNFIGNLTKGFQACTVVSTVEKTILERILPANQPIHIIPNCVDIERYNFNSRQSEPDTLIFTGSLAYNANYDAVHFFLRDILPHVKQAVPGVKFSITGKTGGRHIPSKLKPDHVNIVGFVDDVKPLIANSCASVVPLIEGGGTRLKILEALALGTPVISTSKGAEGLELQRECHILIADTPQDFTAATIQLLSNPGLRDRLSKNGRRFVQENYDWKVVMPKFLDIVESFNKS